MSVATLTDQLAKNNNKFKYLHTHRHTHTHSYWYTILCKSLPLMIKRQERVGNLNVSELNSATTTTI